MISGNHSQRSQFFILQKVLDKWAAPLTMFVSFTFFPSPETPICLLKLKLVDEGKGTHLQVCTILSAISVYTRANLGWFPSLLVT